jgi:hypothetical protein
MRSPICIGCVLALIACTNSEEVYSSVSHVTRIVVDPNEFLGTLSCGTPEGMVSYQATLFDVTPGLDAAFQLPSSVVTSCSTKTNFELVEPGHRYMATVVGFDKQGLKFQNPGSPVVVDSSGKSAVPRWSTTCWGTDEAEDTLGGGGMGPSPDGQGGQMEGQGGSGDAELVGVTSYLSTEMVVKGCEPLQGESSTRTAVAFDLERSMIGFGCGDGPEELSEYSVELVDKEEAGGGVGGAGGSSSADGPEWADCGKVLELDGFRGGQYPNFKVLGYESDSAEPSWVSLCTAYTRYGTTVSARCEGFIEL